MKKFYLTVFMLGCFVFFHGILGAQEANLTRVGEWGTGHYHDVSIKGNHAFCTASDHGLDIIDISNPSLPMKVGNFDEGDFVYRVDVSGNYAYLTTGNELVIVDVSDPTLPVRVSRYYATGQVSDVQVKDNYAYLAVGSYQGYNSLQIINVSSPSAPFLSGKYDINPIFAPTGLFVRGSYVYLAIDFALYIFDITDPTAPELVGQVGVSGYTVGVVVSGNYAYVSFYIFDGGWANGYLDIIDITNPTSPIKVSTYTSYYIPGNIFVNGNNAYFAVGDGGLHIIDVSTPSKPSLVKNYQTVGTAEGVVKVGENLFVADNGGGLQILDVSDPDNPTLKGAYDYSADILDVAVKGNYAYVAGNKEGLLIFNISTPSAPSLVSTHDPGGRVEEVFISGSYAYVISSKDLFAPTPGETLYIIDISNPASPSLAGTYDPSSFIEDVYVSGNYAYVLLDPWTLEILNISDPSQITKAGTYTTSESNSGIWVSRNYAYVTHPSAGVEVLNVSNPATPAHAGSIAVADSPWDIYVNGNYAYVTGGELTILDISTPASPSLVGTYDYGNLGSVFRLYAKGNYVYLPNSSDFRIVDVSNPASPTLAADYHVSESKGVYADGNYVYVAGADYGKLLVLYLEENTTSPQMQLSPGQLQFVADTSGSTSESQTIYVNNTGGGTLDWEVSSSDDWIIYTPAPGTNRGVVDVSVDANGLAPGTYTGSVFFSSPNAGNSPGAVAVSLTVHQSGQTSSPFGAFETPTHGAVVYSSVPFTGWVLDDVGVQGVQLFREESGSLVYIGDAVLVEGARPDVEQAYPGYPNNHKAGWGYMMLTNYLPNQGNGSFTIHAIATDVEGNRVTLGTKTIIADNDNAVKPFGAIDTPAQGGAASGSSYVNFGWVLTPLPNTIPKDGSTIRVWVDGVPIGHPVYNNYRADVAAAFPDYNNSDGAVGYFYLDTTQYANGVHTIQWTAADDAGNTDGIGSRYFTIQSSGFRQQAQRSPDLSNSRNDFAPVTVLKGFDKNTPPKFIYPGDNDVITVEIKELERIELGLAMNVTAAYQVVGQRYRALPWGSFLDRETGVFYWQPGHGFVGRYRLVFVKIDDSGNQTRKDVEVIIHPKY
jgi:hypothetical protein